MRAQERLREILEFGWSAYSIILGLVIGFALYFATHNKWTEEVPAIAKVNVEKVKVQVVEKEDLEGVVVPIQELYNYLKELREAEQWSDSLEYLACCVEAEAGNQSELGKRLVCDVVLNRYDKGGYDNLYEVINERDQFAVVSNGLIENVIPSEETYKVVQQELQYRTNNEVLYFKAGDYHSFGTPLFKEDDHYFSK